MAAVVARVAAAIARVAALIPPVAAVAALAVAIAAAGTATPAAAVTFDRSLGRRVVTYHSRAVDSLVALPDRLLLKDTDSLWVDGAPRERGVDYRLTAEPPRLVWLRQPADSSVVLLRYRYLPLPLAGMYQHPGIWSPASPVPAAGTAGPPSEGPGVYASGGASAAASGAAGGTSPAIASPVAGAGSSADAGSTAGSFGRFSVSGSKTLAFEVASNRDMAVRQSLDLSLGGEIGQDLSVVALLSDRNLPVTPEGRTQDLSSLDKVVVEIKSPSFAASLGDYDLQLSAGEYGSIARTVQGVRGRLGGLTRGPQMEVAAALGKGEFVSRQFLGEEGRQGPYLLTDNAGRSDVSIVPGTEVVWLDGEKMSRGDNADYVVDYSRGQITFTARRPIHPGSRIAVDYQFAADQFRRNLFVARTGYSWEDHGSLHAAWLREADDPGHPVGAALTPEDVSALQHAGSAGLVTTNGAHLVGVGHGDYRRIAPGDSAEHFQYVGRDSGDYQVDFMLAPPGETGSYTDSIASGGLAFGWRGPGRGAYQAGRLLPVPQSHSLADVGGSLHSGALRLDGEGAMSLRDVNLLGTQGTSAGGAWNLGATLAPRLRLGGHALGMLEWETRARRQEESFEALGRNLAPFAEEEWNLGTADRTRGRTVLSTALRYHPDARTMLGVELGSWRTSAGTRARRLLWSSERQGAGNGAGGVGGAGLGWRMSWSEIANRDSSGGESGSRRRGQFEAWLGAGSVRPLAHWNHDAAVSADGVRHQGYEDYGLGLSWKAARGWTSEIAQTWRRDDLAAAPIAGGTSTAMAGGVGASTATPGGIATPGGSAAAGRVTRTAGADTVPASAGALVPPFGLGAPLRSSTQRASLTYAASPDWSLTGSISQRSLGGTADSLGSTRNALVQALLHHAGLEGEAHYEISAAQVLGQRRQVSFVGPGLGAYDSLGNFVGRGDYSVHVFDEGTFSPSNQVQLSARMEWSGERDERTDWLRHWVSRTETQSTSAARRSAGTSLAVWPGSLVSDADVLRGNATFRQDLEWNQGPVGIRIRHEWAGDADRQYSSYQQLHSNRTESARLRLTGQAGTSLELESRWGRRDVAVGPPEAAPHFLSHALDTDMNLRWAPDARWSLGLVGRWLSESDPQRGAGSRQMELGPSLIWSRGGRFRAELKANRVLVREQGGIEPGFSNYGALLRSRLEHDLNLTYQLRSAIQASVFAHGTHPDGDRWLETARLEMRALF